MNYNPCWLRIYNWEPSKLISTKYQCKRVFSVSREKSKTINVAFQDFTSQQFVIVTFHTLCMSWYVTFEFLPFFITTTNSIIIICETCLYKLMKWSWRKRKWNRKCVVKKGYNLVDVALVSKRMLNILSTFCLTCLWFPYVQTSISISFSSIWNTL